MSIQTKITLALIMCLLAIGCQEYAEVTLTPAQQKKVEAFTLTAAPSPQNPLNVVIEDQVRLLGYDLDKKEVKAGESITITYYFEALAHPMGDNNMFFHFQGSLGDRRAWMNLDHHPIEGLLPLRKMQKGQIIKDIQTIKVKPDFPSGTAKIYWGLFRGNNRLKVKNKTGVSVTKDGRVVITSVKVKGTVPVKPRFPTARAMRLKSTEHIVLDGKMTEPLWKRAKWTAYWTSPDGRGRPVPKSRAKFVWDDTYLYIGVHSEDHDVWGTLTERDSNTWEQEVIEVFIDADGDKKDYLELQVSPANVVFDAKFKRHRSDLKVARGWNMKGWQTAVFVDGTLNKRDDKDRGYTVEMMIPVSEVPGARTPLKARDSWRVNLFRWDQEKGKRQKASAFSPPVVGDFHALDRFGRLRFEGLPQLKTLGPKKSPRIRQSPIKGPQPNRLKIKTPKSTSDTKKTTP